MKKRNPRPRAIKIAATVCRIIVASVFIFSGFVKAVDPWGTCLKTDEYLSIYGMDALMPVSMIFSIWLCGAELMMGCMLMFKVRIRLISIFAICSMTFFTVLTFFSATLFPVEDCGCFGDAWHLTPWQTFAKNMVLLPMVFVIWYRYRPDRIFAFTRLEIALTCLFCTIGMGVGTYCYFHLPLIDFLPYKVGVNIAEAKAAADADAAKPETIIVCRNVKSGRIKEFSLDDKEWHNEKRWEWVDTRVADDDEAAGKVLVRALISEFNINDAEGVATDEILSMPGKVYMICVTSFDKVGERCAARLRRVIERAEAEDALAICLTPEPLREVTYRGFDGSDEIRCYNIDAQVMKTMLRANTGLVELTDGVITAKYNCRDIE